jgi:hypothetical protein
MKNREAHVDRNSDPAMLFRTHGVKMRKSPVAKNSRCNCINNEARSIVVIKKFTRSLLCKAFHGTDQL